MGNSIGKKRKMASSPSKKKQQSLESHLVSLTSSSLRNMTVEFPKEIEEDLERRKIESFKALAAGSKRPARKTPSSAFSANPAHELYEKMRTLDVPAVMVPKPWSEVDEILSKHKSSLADEAALSPKPTPDAKSLVPAQQPETIDMSELMEDLYEGAECDDDGRPTDEDASTHQTHAKGFQPVEYAPKKIRTLETSVSFSTIHTIKEVEGAASRPESVKSIMRSKSTLDSSRVGPAAAVQKANASAVSTAPPRRVKVNPRLLARVQAFS